MIRIEVQTRSGDPLPALSADFDERGGTIGRAQGNTLVLVDPRQHISRTQAFIAFRGTACFLRDNGSAVPTMVNGNAVGKGNEVPVRDGDRIEIGDYTLAVRATGVGPVADPFADPFGISPPAPSRASANVIPADFDSLPRSFDASSSPMSAGEDDIPIMRSATENLDALFGLNEPGLAHALGHEDPLAAAPGSSASSADPLSALLTPHPRSPSAVPQRDDGHILSTAIPLPEPIAAPKVPADRMPNRVATPAEHITADLPRRHVTEPTPPDRGPLGLSSHAGTTADADELLRAFLAGTGVHDLQLSKGLTPEVMNLLGQLLRESIRGTLELLAARALTKREIRARDITMIRAEKNNPLKHSGTFEAALNTLLAPQLRGFMAPAEAMRDAYRDLRSHQFGVIAGTRAALAGVLERFDPARLEKRLTQRGAIDAILPGARKARLWEMFEQLYSELSKEAEDDFEALFGRAFLKAYEAQIEKLKEEEGQD